MWSVLNGTRSPRWDDIEQIQKTNDAEDEADEDLKPDHPDVSILENSFPVPPPDLLGLLHSRPCRDPSNTQGETPGERREDDVRPCHRLKDVVRGQEGDHHDVTGALGAPWSCIRDPSSKGGNEKE